MDRRRRRRAAHDKPVEVCVVLSGIACSSPVPLPAESQGKAAFDSGGLRLSWLRRLRKLPYSICGVWVGVVVLHQLQVTLDRLVAGLVRMPGRGLGGLNYLSLCALTHGRVWHRWDVFTSMVTPFTEREASPGQLGERRVSAKCVRSFWSFSSWP